MTAVKLFNEAQLLQAIAACESEVKRVPTAIDPRYLLSQLLCFNGDWERADTQLHTLGIQCEERRKEFSLMRHLIRAATIRQLFFTQGGIPDFTHPPDDNVKRYVEAVICLRENQTAEANELLDAAEADRPALPGQCNGEAFEDMRDGDDVTAFVLEVFTSTGRYYWVPFDRIQRLLLEPIQVPVDTLWRPARMEFVGGANAVGYVPATYVGSSASDDEEIRLGRATQWQGGNGECIRGLGHRLFLFASGHRALADITELSFQHAADVPPKSDAGLE